MVSLEERIFTALFHAAPNQPTLYDPQKAHDYYERTKQLKGRHDHSGLKGANQKEGWAYVQSKVREEQKGALTSAAESNKQAVTQLQNMAQQKRVEFQQKLKDLVKKISDDAASSSVAIDAKAQAAIDALPKTPPGLGKAQAAAWADDRRNQIAKIRGDALVEKSKTNDTKTGLLAKSKDDSNTQLQALAEEIKNSVNKARDNYTAAKASIKSKYQDQMDKEFDYVKANV